MNNRLLTNTELQKRREAFETDSPISWSANFAIPQERMLLARLYDAEWLLEHIQTELVRVGLTRLEVIDEYLMRVARKPEERHE